MTLQELRYFIALAKYKHFRKAAEHCHVSQPSLSVAIKKLEDELGVLLFERFKNEVRLTQAGEKIVEHANEVILQAENLGQIAANFKSPFSGALRLGFIYSVGIYVYPKLLRQLHESAPKMPVQLYEGYTHDLKEKLIDGDVDVAVVALPFYEPNILTRTLYTEPFEVLLPANHPLSEKEMISPDELKDYHILTLGAGHCFGDQVKALCPHCKEDSHQGAFEGTSLEAIRYMVYSGMGITILPKTAAMIPAYLQSDLVTRPIVDSHAERKIALAWRISYTRTTVIDILIKAFQSLPFGESVRFC